MLYQKINEALNQDQLVSELESKTPVLLYILKVCTSTKGQRVNTNAVIGTCVVIITKHRYFKMSLVQKKSFP